jgi:hypothetical protein
MNKNSTRYIDLTGQRFGRLVVVSLSDESYLKNRPAMWNCKCDCGNEIVAWSHALKSGNTRSCGCLRDEISSNRYKVFIEHDGERKCLTDWGKVFGCRAHEVYKHILEREGRLDKQIMK